MKPAAAAAVEIVQTCEYLPLILAAVPLVPHGGFK
jgi:hypothetical protein